MLGILRPPEGLERVECGSLRLDHRHEGWGDRHNGAWGQLEQDNCSSPETQAEAPRPGCSEVTTPPVSSDASKKKETHRREQATMHRGPQPGCPRTGAAAQETSAALACPEQHTEMGA